MAIKTYKAIGRDLASKWGRSDNPNLTNITDEQRHFYVTCAIHHELLTANKLLKQIVGRSSHAKRTPKKPRKEKSNDQA